MPTRTMDSRAEALISAEDGLMRATGQPRRALAIMRTVLVGVIFAAVVLVGLTGIYTIRQVHTHLHRASR